MVSYKLTRSNRKTISLYVRDGYVEVRAPLKTPKGDIDKFVLSKEKWIDDKLAKSNERAAQRESFRLAYGDKVLYRGQEYPITERCGDHVGFCEASFYIPPGLPPEQIRRACKQIYMMLAKRDLTNRTLDIARTLSLVPSAIKINNAKTRWGSCSEKGSVNYSWRLIMADDEVIEYVIVHELAHIAEPNHSPRFWAIVKGALPDYAARRARLKELQHRLGAEDWD